MRKEIEQGESPYKAVNELREVLAELSPIKDNPVDKVLWVPLDKVQANDYNPNQVGKVELRLLYKSIKEDGYTQPIVTVRDEEKDKYEIVDGFHRYLVMRTYKDISERSDGHIPIVVIDSDMKGRMASTIRHNRARGKHNVAGMSHVVFNMLKEGWSDEDICSQLGMEKEEIARLKHVTGFSRLFDKTDYSQPWKTTRMIEVEKLFKDKQREKE